MNASAKEAKLNWLKEEPPANTCRILSNVRCLSEGVDVPALDAVLFLTPRNSQVDVVQSVGRVMRNAPGKKRGYVVLPVVIPAGMEPHEALNDNQTYKVVWQVLQALRSHDDSFDAMVNKLDLIGSDPRKMEVIAITDKADKKARKTSGTSNGQAGKGQYGIGEKRAKYDVEGQMTQQAELAYEVGKSRRPSTPKSSTSAATAITGKTGQTTLPRSPAPILTASRASWRTRPTSKKRLPSTPSPPSCATTSTTASAMARLSKCSPSTW